ncbi:hypothetical protein LXL04_014778 [Taraxacum kok-saghyz]
MNNVIFGFLLTQLNKSRYTLEVTTRNLDVLRLSAHDILSTLGGIFRKSDKDDGGSIQKTIGEFASIADKGIVSSFFKATMQKLLKVTEEAGKVQNTKNSNSMETDNSSVENSLSQTRTQLYDLAVSLLPGLVVKEVDLLCVAIEPALKDPESCIQKKAYKVLSTILEDFKLVRILSSSLQQKEAERRAKPDEIANRRRKSEQDPEAIKRLRN